MSSAERQSYSSNLDHSVWSHEVASYQSSYGAYCQRRISDRWIPRPPLIEETSCSCCFTTMRRLPRSFHMEWRNVSAMPSLPSDQFLWVAKTLGTRHRQYPAAFGIMVGLILRSGMIRRKEVDSLREIPGTSTACSNFARLFDCHVGIHRDFFLRRPFILL
jgi:hypothetical protein